jgi:mediator of RNA polymerase II transcription subunit 6
MEGQGEDTGTVFFFRDEAFLRGIGTLTIANVLDYFSCSQFYDPDSLNQQAKQNLQSDLEVMIQNQDGISFRITLAQQAGGARLEGDALKKPENLGMPVLPGLIIIDKVIKDGGRDSVLAKYYILDGTVFQAPALYGLLAARIRSAVFHVRESLREVRNMFEWNVETGFKKRVASAESETVYVFKQSDLKEVAGEVVSEISLQNGLLDSLLKEIGIT